LKKVWNDTEIPEINEYLASTVKDTKNIGKNETDSEYLLSIQVITTFKQP
jgi:hypothetical protein